MEEKIAKIMKSLQCTREEAIDVITQDEIIDKGGRTYFDLPKEQEKAAKKMCNVTEHKKTSYKFTKRERKPDEIKEGLIADIAQYLTSNDFEDVQIINKSKLIDFKIGDVIYEIDLKRTRKKA